MNCPQCQHSPTTITGSHGLVVHMFFEHQMTGDDIQTWLLQQKPPITVLSTGQLGPDWWDKARSKQQGD